MELRLGAGSLEPDGSVTPFSTEPQCKMELRLGRCSRVDECHPSPLAVSRTAKVGLGSA